MKKIGIVITDGVGYRNFVLSDFMVEAQKQFSRVVLLSCLPKEAFADLDLECDIIELEVFEESFATWFFRKAKEVAHLQLHRKGNFGITDNFKANYSTTKTPRGFATRFIYQFTNWFHSEVWILRYNRWQQFTFRQHPITKKYKQLLQDLQLDSLFFTHQRPPYIAPLVYAAEQLQLKTTAFIFSWDNLASKGRMAANFDGYLVWSELMKQELLTSLPPSYRRQEEAKLAAENKAQKKKLTSAQLLRKIKTKHLNFKKTEGYRRAKTSWLSLLPNIPKLLRNRIPLSYVRKCICFGKLLYYFFVTCLTF